MCKPNNHCRCCIFYEKLAVVGRSLRCRTSRIITYKKIWLKQNNKDFKHVSSWKSKKFLQGSQLWYLSAKKKLEECKIPFHRWLMRQLCRPVNSIQLQKCRHHLGCPYSFVLIYLTKKNENQIFYWNNTSFELGCP